MHVQPWQIPVLVMAGVIVLEFPVQRVARALARRRYPRSGERQGLPSGRRPSGTASSTQRQAAAQAIAQERAALAAGHVRTTALALLAALILVIFIWAVGTSTADKLATVASATIELMALWLAYQSHQDQKRLREQIDNQAARLAGLTDQGEGDAPGRHASDGSASEM